MTETQERISRASEQGQRYMVISTDGHVGPSVKDELREYCDAKYLDEFDRYASEMYNQTYTKTNNFSMPKEHLERHAKHGQVRGLHDPHARLADMDTEGVAAEVIFHGGQNGESIPFSTFGLATWGSSEYKDLESVGYHIYNRWLADYCSVAPDRLVGIAHIPVWDLDAAIREIVWAKEAGLCAVNLPAQRRDFPNYNEPVWEPLWATCADLAMPLNTHAGGGDFPPYSGQESTALWMMEMAFYGRRNLWHLIFGGVFERHPGLKYALTEQSADWVPETLRDMDSVYNSYQVAHLREKLPELPSTYFDRNCFIGASFMAAFEARMAIDGGFDHKMMWGADYPHQEGTWPRTLLAMQKTFSGLPVATVAGMLGETAVDVFGLDRDKLSAVASRIGPLVSDVETPPATIPEYRGLAFRDIGKYA